MKTEKSTGTSINTTISDNTSLALLQVMGFLYALAHSYNMQHSTRWGISLTDLRDEFGDAVFTGNIYTHDATETPRFYRWLRFQLSQTKGIHNLAAYEDEQLIKEIPTTTFQSFRDYAVELFEPSDFSYEEPVRKTAEMPVQRRKSSRRSSKKPSLQELFDFCYEVSYHNGGILDWNIGVCYLHDNDNRIYFDFSPGRQHQKGTPVQKFFPNISFCYSETIGIYAVFLWEDARTPLHYNKLSFDDLKALVCRLFQIDSGGRSLLTKET